MWLSLTHSMWIRQKCVRCLSASGWTSHAHFALFSLLISQRSNQTGQINRNTHHIIRHLFRISSAQTLPDTDHLFECLSPWIWLYVLCILSSLNAGCLAGCNWGELSLSPSHTQSLCCLCRGAETSAAIREHFQIPLSQSTHIWRRTLGSYFTGSAFSTGNIIGELDATEFLMWYKPYRRLKISPREISIEDEIRRLLPSLKAIHLK